MGNITEFHHFSIGTIRLDLGGGDAVEVCEIIVFRFVENEIDKTVVDTEINIGTGFKFGCGAHGGTAFKTVNGIRRRIGQSDIPDTVRLDLVTVFRVVTVDLQPVFKNIHDHDPQCFTAERQDGAAHIDTAFFDTAVTQRGCIDGGELTLPDAAFIFQRTMGVGGKRNDLRKIIEHFTQSGSAAFDPAGTSAFRLEMGNDKNRFGRISCHSFFQCGTQQSFAIFFAIIALIVGGECNKIISGNGLADGIRFFIAEDAAEIGKDLFLTAFTDTGMTPEIVISGAGNLNGHFFRKIFFDHFLIIFQWRNAVTTVGNIAAVHQDIDFLICQDAEGFFAVVHTPILRIGIGLDIADDPDTQYRFSGHIFLLSSG